MTEDLTNLPFEIQFVLVAGYLGYWVANVGLRKSVPTQDMVMQILVYGLVAKGAQAGFVSVAASFFGYRTNTESLPWAAMLASLIIALAAGVLWRRFGLKWFTESLRRTRLSNETATHSTLTEISQDGQRRWTYFVVILADGTCLRSSLPKTEGLPHGPLLIDQEGNVGLYVTEIKRPNGEIDDFTDEFDNPQDFDPTITYVPASQIVRMNINWTR